MFGRKRDTFDEGYKQFLIECAAKESVLTSVAGKLVVDRTRQAISLEETDEQELVEFLADVSDDVDAMSADLARIAGKFGLDAHDMQEALFLNEPSLRNGWEQRDPEPV